MGWTTDILTGVGISRVYDHLAGGREDDGDGDEATAPCEAHGPPTVVAVPVEPTGNPYMDEATAGHYRVTAAD